MTGKDRIMSALIGLWAGLWIGGLGRVIYATPVGGGDVLRYALLGAVICAAIGGTIPKHSRIIFLPFCLFGFGTS